MHKDTSVHGDRGEAIRSRSETPMSRENRLPAVARGSCRRTFGGTRWRGATGVLGIHNCPASTNGNASPCASCRGGTNASNMRK